MAPRPSTRLIVGAVGAIVVAAAVLVVALALRSGDDDEGRPPDQELAAPDVPVGPAPLEARWSADGAELYVVDETGIEVLAGEPLERVRRIEHEGSVSEIVWNRDHSRVLLWSRVDGSATAWDLAAGERLPDVESTHNAPVAAWSPDGTRVAVLEDEGVIVVRDAATGDEVARSDEFVSDGQVLGLSWPLPDRIVGGTFRLVRAIDPASGEEAWERTFATDGVMAPSPDGALLAVGAFSDDDHQVFAVANGVARGELETASAVLLSVAWSPSGEWLLAAGDDDRPRLWQTSAGTAREELDDVAPYAAGASWAPDGERVAVPDIYDERILLVDALGAVDDEELSMDGTVIRTVAWSPQGDRLVAAGEDGSVRVWDVSPAED